MGSATPTPLAIVRNRPSNESVISTPFGTRRIPFADEHVSLEDHADREIVHAHRARFAAAARGDRRFHHRFGDGRRQVRDELANLLRGGLRRASLVDELVEAHSGPEDCRAELLRVPCWRDRGPRLPCRVRAAGPPPCRRRPRGAESGLTTFRRPPGATRTACFLLRRAAVRRRPWRAFRRAA